MSAWASIGRLAWRATRAFFLIVFASIIGAYVGTLGGYGLAALTGDWGWVNHGRCAGWTIFVAMAIVGIPTGHVRFCNKRPSLRSLPPEECERAELEPAAAEAVKVEGRLKSLLIAPLLGAFMGLIVGGMVGGFLIAVYFFVALSPLGPGGWWPVLPLTFQAAGDGFSSSDPLWLIPWLTVIGAFVLAGALLGLVGTTTVGNRRYEVLGRK
jgi:MFS family permease